MSNSIFESMQRRLGSSDAALKRKQRMDQDVRYAHSHLEEWRQAFPNTWIAVFKEKLLAAESSRERLLEKLDQSRVPIGQVYIDFIEEKQTTLIL